jgi:hypothetical protein
VSLLEPAAFSKPESQPLDYKPSRKLPTRSLDRLPFRMAEPGLSLGVVPGSPGTFLVTNRG